MPDSAALRELRVFISSPGDVSEERVLAAQVIERLRLEFAGSIRLTTVLWEHEPLFAHAGFQDQLPLPSECDLVVSILWSRIGTRLHPRFARPADGRVPTGTEFEIEDALESYRRIGRPNLLVFVKDAAVEGDLRAADIQERVTQRKDLEDFIRLALIERPALGLAAHHRFASSWEFARRVEDQLRKWLQLRVGADLKAQAAWLESPYRGLEVFEAEHRLIFCGRGRAISQVMARLRTLAAAMAAWTHRPPAERASATDGTATMFDEPRMFLLVQGMSGNGKSSLIRAGILPLLQVGALEGVGEWRQAVLRPSDRDGDLALTLARALTTSAALPELVSAGESVESLAADLRLAPNGTLADSRVIWRRLPKIEVCRPSKCGWWCSSTSWRSYSPTAGSTPKRAAASAGCWTAWHPASRPGWWRLCAVISLIAVRRSQSWAICVAAEFSNSTNPAPTNSRR